MKTLGILLLLTCWCFAEVKSTTGTIDFYPLETGPVRMSLTSQGLGIGGVPAANLSVHGNAIITGSLSLGSASSTSNLNIGGSLGFSAITLSSSVNLGETEAHSQIFANTASSNITLRLPYSGNVMGRIYQIKKISPLNALSITAGSNLIDDQTYLHFPASANLQQVQLISTGQQYHILSAHTDVAQVASANLRGWWKLDETTLGTVTDYSGRGVHGTHVNMSTSTVGNASKVVRGLNFPANTLSDYVDLGTNINMTNWSALSVTAWYCPIGSGWEHAFFSNGNINFGMAKHDKPDYRVLAAINYPSSYIYNQGGMSANIFYHIAMTYESGNVLRTYINGNVSTSYGNSCGFITSSKTLKIGENGINNNDFHCSGIVDDIRIYDKRLSSEEIQQIMGGSYP